MKLHLLISTLSLGVYYFLSLTLSVCMTVCLSVTNIDSSFLFLNGIEPFFDRKFSMTKTTKRCASIFDLGPLMPKIYSQKFAQNLHGNDIWARCGDPVAFPYLCIWFLAVSVQCNVTLNLYSAQAQKFPECYGVIFSTVQTGMFLTHAWNCLLKVRDRGDIQVKCSRSSNSKRTGSVGG